MKKRSNRFLSIFELIYKSFKMSPANYFTLIGSSLVVSAKEIITMILPALLLDIIMKTNTFNKVMIAIVIYALIILIADASEKVFSLLSTAFGYKAKNRASLEVGQKGMRIDYGSWEDAETYEKNRKASNSTWVFQSVADLVCEYWIAAIITLIPVLYIFFQINLLVVTFILILILFEMFLERRADKKAYAIDVKKARDDKKLDYNRRIMNDIRYGKELRLYDARDGVINKYEESKKSVFDYDKKKKKIERNYKISSGIITCIQGIIIFSFAIEEYRRGAIGISAFLLLIGVIQQFSDSIKTIIVATVWAQDITDYYSDYKAFMDEPEDLLQANVGQEMNLSNFDIEFKNVSFCYPGQKNYAIKNLNLTIPHNTKLAIVGENGAGKTTLIKLLLRLYDVDEGEIIMGGKNIKDLDYTSYMKLFAPVFQDYKLHAYSLRENIQFLDENNDELLWDLLSRQGMYDAVKKSPKGLDTFITKELDEEGKDFSGGEKQRLAVVRALYKEAPIYVLDEPTSAIDPLSELQYFENLHIETENKTAIYITHRMASTKYSDNIIVMDKGEIVESGSFEELINVRNTFYKSFNLQASYYK